MATGAGVVDVMLVPDTEFTRPRMSFFRSDSKKRDTKKGRIDRTSIIFKVSVKNSHFFGAPAKLTKIEIHYISKISCYTP